MNELESAVDRLGEALLLAHSLSSPGKRREDCSREEITAREIYSHIHWAIKDLTKLYKIQGKI